MGFFLDPSFSGRGIDAVSHSTGLASGGNGGKAGTKPASICGGGTGGSELVPDEEAGIVEIFSGSGGGVS